MAVAFSSHVSSGATASTNLLVTITVSGTNPVLIGKVALGSSSATVTSMTWNAGSGTTVQVTSQRNTSSTGPLVSIWAVPAPTASTNGSIRAGFSKSAFGQFDCSLFTGADQTTPCPSADSKTSTSNVTGIVLTPANLVSGDASDGMGGNVVSGNWNSASTNQRSINNVSQVGYITGDSINTTAIRFTTDGAMPANGISSVGVRIQQPVSAAAATRYFSSGDLNGIQNSGRFFKDKLAYGILRGVYP